MYKNKHKKVCIVASSLSKGGAERSSANLSQMLTQLGYDVHIVTVMSGIDYEFLGKHLDLGSLKIKNDTRFGRIKRLLFFRRYLSKNHFDVIIDNRTRVQAYREFIISKLIYKKPVIYVIHNYNEEKAFTKYKSLNRWLYKNEFMTAVSLAAKEKFKKKYNLKRIRTIYNGFNFKDIKALAQEAIHYDIPQDYILFFGRLDDYHKNLKLLLDAYKSSRLEDLKVKLLILGDGPDLELLKTYSEELNLSKDVLFIGYQKNPYPFVKNAKFTVLTSRFEGFPMVIPESLCLSIPMVSVDCNSGPNEIIQTGFNGILVENYNVVKLAEAFNTLVSDTKLYNICVSNTVSSIQKFSTAHVMQSWSQLLNEVMCDEN